jgi:hypothetical protein
MRPHAAMRQTEKWRESGALATIFIRQRRKKTSQDGRPDDGQDYT